MEIRKTYEMTEWLSPQEAADLSGGLASRPTFLDWAKNGQIAAVKLPSGRWKIKRAAVEALMIPSTASPDIGEDVEGDVLPFEENPLPGLALSVSRR